MAPDFTGEPSKWVCRLLAHFQGSPDPISGTGFLVNMPFTNKHCIITAGHVIQRPAEGRAVKMEVFFPEGGLTGRPTFTADASELFVADVYAHAPTLNERDTSAVSDYGLVALDKTRHSTPPGIDLAGGCALDILPTRSELLHTGGTVYGYGKGAEMQTKKTSPFARPIEHHILEYQKELDGREGVSGGPLFVSHNGSDVAIGIHNYNGRATRITIAVMLDILTWLGDYELYRTFADSSRPKVFLQSTSGRLPNVLARPGAGPDATWRLVPVCIPKGTSKAVYSYVLISSRPARSATSFHLLAIETDESTGGTKTGAPRAPAARYTVTLKESSFPRPDCKIVLWPKPKKNTTVKMGTANTVLLVVKPMPFGRVPCPCGCISQDDEVAVVSRGATWFEIANVAPASSC